jgi:hypothetical protein
MADRAPDKRLRRAAEQVQRCLARRDLTGAVGVLMELPAQARIPLLAVVAPAFPGGVAALAARGGWGELHTLAARAEVEPGLLPAAATESPTPSEAAASGADQTRWRLLLACLRAKDWSRAGRYLTALRPLLATQSPVLEQIVAAWIARKGELDPDAVAATGWRAAPSPARDPRLGHEPAPRARPCPPAPTAAPQAETAVLALAATRPFSAFTDGVIAWLTAAAGPVALEIRQTAAGLAVRELLRAASAGAPLSRGCGCSQRPATGPSPPRRWPGSWSWRCG